ELDEETKPGKKLQKLKKPKAKTPGERDELELEVPEDFEDERPDRPEGEDTDKESWSKRSSVADEKDKDKPTKLKVGKGKKPEEVQEEEHVKLKPGKKIGKEEETPEEIQLRSRPQKEKEEEEEEEAKLKPKKKPGEEEDVPATKRKGKKKDKPEDLKDIESERPELEKYEKPEWPSKDKDSKDKDIKTQPQLSSEELTDTDKDTRPRPGKEAPEGEEGELPLGKGKIPEEVPADEQVKLKPHKKPKDEDKDKGPGDRPIKPQPFEGTEGDVELEKPEFGKDKPKKKKKPEKASAELAGTTSEDTSPEGLPKEKQKGPSESEDVADKMQRDKSALAPEDDKARPEKFISEAVGPDGKPLEIRGEGVASEDDEKEQDKTGVRIRKSKKPKKGAKAKTDLEGTTSEGVSPEDIPSSREGTSEEDDVVPAAQKGTSAVRPKGKKKPRETQITEITGPDGTPTVVEVEDVTVLEVKGPEGTLTLVQVQESDLTEEEKRKVKRVKKIRKNPKDVEEAELPSLISEEVVEEGPEVVFTEAVGPDGK
ncbi:unnamed protein product, partial [Allacma fusca]